MHIHMRPDRHRMSRWMSVSIGLVSLACLPSLPPVPRGAKQCCTVSAALTPVKNEDGLRQNRGLWSVWPVTPIHRGIESRSQLHLHPSVLRVTWALVTPCCSPSPQHLLGACPCKGPPPPAWRTLHHRPSSCLHSTSDSTGFGFWGVGLSNPPTAPKVFRALVSGRRP